MDWIDYVIPVVINMFRLTSVWTSELIVGTIWSVLRLAALKLKNSTSLRSGLKQLQFLRSASPRTLNQMSPNWLARKLRRCIHSLKRNVILANTISKSGNSKYEMGSPINGLLPNSLALGNRPLDDLILKYQIIYIRSFSIAGHRCSQLLYHQFQEICLL